MEFPLPHQPKQQGFPAPGKPLPGSGGRAGHPPQHGLPPRPPRGLGGTRGATPPSLGLCLWGEAGPPKPCPAGAGKGRLPPPSAPRGWRSRAPPTRGSGGRGRGAGGAQSSRGAAGGASAGERDPVRAARPPPRGAPGSEPTAPGPQRAPQPAARSPGPEISARPASRRGRAGRPRRGRLSPETRPRAAGAWGAQSAAPALPPPRPDPGGPAGEAGAHPGARLPAPAAACSSPPASPNKPFRASAPPARRVRRISGSSRPPRPRAPPGAGARAASLTWGRRSVRPAEGPAGARGQPGRGPGPGPKSAAAASGPRGICALRSPRLAASAAAEVGSGDAQPIGAGGGGKPGGRGSPSCAAGIGSGSGSRWPGRALAGRPGRCAAGDLERPRPRAPRAPRAQSAPRRPRPRAPPVPANSARGAAENPGTRTSDSRRASGPCPVPASARGPPGLPPPRGQVQRPRRRPHSPRPPPPSLGRTRQGGGVGPRNPPGTGRPLVAPGAVRSAPPRGWGGTGTCGDPGWNWSRGAGRRTKEGRRTAKKQGDNGALALREARTGMGGRRGAGPRGGGERGRGAGGPGEGPGWRAGGPQDRGGRVGKLPPLRTARDRARGGRPGGARGAAPRPAGARAHAGQPAREARRGRSRGVSGCAGGLGVGEALGVRGEAGGGPRGARAPAPPAPRPKASRGPASRPRPAPPPLRPPHSPLTP
ncbi:collagen alpha-1(I) chain-like [Canis lupus dingo]|uniref:collagen alpha-1(I) chain-like n=1 Tax=Canis lupus dingo TaxID=286419 RepID=UPI0020C27EC1|nr:collagen alpha-1(I) chain-like [Canis lupus dingo]